MQSEQYEVAGPLLAASKTVDKVTVLSFSACAKIAVGILL